MAALTRKFKKIFGKDSSNNGVFGSAAALAPATSTDPETIESLSAFLDGWSSATEGGLKLPTLEDMQGLKYDTDYHLAYIYQDGMQVYNSQTTYYINNLVRENATGKIWKSLINDNVGNSLVEGANWTLLANLAYTPTAALGTAAYINTGTSSGRVPLVGTQSATTSLAGLSYLSSPITIANNPSDSFNDIDFSAGVFNFSDGSGQAVATALTKRLDANWTAGNNQGGLFSGAKANSTWYHCFAIYNPTTDTSDFGFDTSVTAANIPSGYTKYKRVGSIVTDGSGNIRGFLQNGNFFFYKSPMLLYSGAFPTVETALTTMSPLGIKTIGIFSSYINTGTTLKALRIYSYDATDAAVDTTNFNGALASIGTSAMDAGSPSALAQTNLSSQVKYKCSAATASSAINQQGYIDNFI